MSQVILISGKQGAGKTSLANYLVSILPKSTRLSFADPIRSLVKGILDAARDIGLDLPEKIEARTLMQFLGTEWGRREIDDLIWVNHAKKQTKNPDHEFFIFDDCRFRNEFDAFPNALRIRLECPADLREKRAKYWGNPDHASEIDLDSYLDRFDMIFDTSDSKDKVKESVKDYMHNWHITNCL